MTEERFHALAAAYGGAISRWPVAERRAARWFALRHRRSAGAILREARCLDIILARSATPIVRLELGESLIGSAAVLVETTVTGRSWFGPALGAGLAAACAAGILAGFAIGPMAADSLASPLDPAELAASALGNPAELGDG
jgi:hypothetical protein